MKNRILTTVVGIALVIVWMVAMYTPFFAALLAFFCAVGVYEMMKAFEMKNIVLRVFYIIIAAIIPFYFEFRTKADIPLFPVITAIVLFSLVVMVLDFKNLKFEQVICSAFSAVFIPSALSCVVLFRDVYINFPDAYKNKSDGLFFLIFAFFCCWLSDIFALLVGMKFGKHKLAPVISPKKTVEGAIGGIVCCALFNVGLFFLFKYKFNLSEEITLPLILISSVLLSVLSIFGDLSASTIKRHKGIKDFGNLLPGHGGVMDRFDSSVAVFPALYAIIITINAI
ncbi:MAG: phosphatidate cytidylyltransferase [Clostridia bacterium]|nr:phosphatidate cytidylyltransferase [Clostridia bacterium]